MFGAGGGQPETVKRVEYVLFKKQQQLYDYLRCSDENARTDNGIFYMHSICSNDEWVCWVTPNTEHYNMQHFKTIPNNPWEVKWACNRAVSCQNIVLLIFCPVLSTGNSRSSPGSMVGTGFSHFSYPIGKTASTQTWALDLPLALNVRHWVPNQRKFSRCQNTNWPH